DMYEHAYAIDYGAAAAKYIDAFFQNIRWDEVQRRLERAQKAGAALHGGPAPFEPFRQGVSLPMSAESRVAEMAVVPCPIWQFFLYSDSAPSASAGRSRSLATCKEIWSRGDAGSRNSLAGGQPSCIEASSCCVWLFRWA